VVIGVAAKEGYAARHHAGRVAIADLKPEGGGIDVHARLEIADVEHDMTDLA
jgi:hypothetical protein